MSKRPELSSRTDDLIVISDEEHDENHPQLVLSQLDSQDIDLSYKSEPALKMFVSQDPDIQTLLTYFIPKTLTELILQNVNNQLLHVVRRDHPHDPQRFNKKKFDEGGLNQYYGLTMLYGILRLPSLNHHYQCEDFLKSGVETIMPQGRFKFIDSNLVNFTNENDTQRLLHLVGDIRKKWRKVYTPDQELVFHIENNPTNSTYYLVDSETQFILDQQVIFHDQGKYQIQKTFSEYEGLNHFIYFKSETMEINQILKLAESAVYCVGYISTDSIKMELLEETVYTDNLMNWILVNGKVLVFPRCKDWKYFEQRSRELEQKTSMTFKNINSLRNPFSYTNKLHNNLIYEKKITPSTLDFKRILLEEYFESTIYNMYVFYNSILIRRAKQSFKNFRIQVSAQLIGDKYQQLENDKKIIYARINKNVVDQTIQTERLSYRLLESYPSHTYHIPEEVSRSQQVKYCSVCMKFDQLTKSQYQCQQCHTNFKTKVYLCMQPCFQLFHQYPSVFLEIDKRLLTPKDNRYYNQDNNSTIIRKLQQEYHRTSSPMEERTQFIMNYKQHPELSGSAQKKIILQQQQTFLEDTGYVPYRYPKNSTQTRYSTRLGLEEQQQLLVRSNNVESLPLDFTKVPLASLKLYGTLPTSFDYFRPPQSLYGFNTLKHMNGNTDSNGMNTKPVLHSSNSSYTKESTKEKQVNFIEERKESPPQQKSYQQSRIELFSSPPEIPQPPAFLSPFEKFMEQVKKKNCSLIPKREDI